MQIIQIKPNMVFILETNGHLPEAQTKAMIDEWNTVLPDNKLIIVPKGALNILELAKD